MESCDLGLKAADFSVIDEDVKSLSLVLCETTTSFLQLSL